MLHRTINAIDKLANCGAASTPPVGTRGSIDTLRLAETFP